MNKVNLKNLSQRVNRDLFVFINKAILPRYDQFDGGHDIRHAKEVMKYSFEIADELRRVDKNVDLDDNMLFTIAAFHDVGLVMGREKHEIYSYKIVMKHKNILKKWFNEDQIKLIATACKEHRASKHNATTLYSKIVADADKVGDTNLQTSIYRAWYFRKNEFHEYTDEQLFDSIYEHLSEKFGEGGYAKFRLKATKRLYSKQQKMTQKMLKNKKACWNVFKAMINNGTLNREQS